MCVSEDEEAVWLNNGGMKYQSINYVPSRPTSQQETLAVINTHAEITSIQCRQSDHREIPTASSVSR